MAHVDEKERLRGEIGAERAQLADAVHVLRSELHAATDIKGKVRAKLPVIAVGAATLGFVTLGGIGATAHFVSRHLRR